MVKKKSFNPFKMWGSWIGLAFGVLVIILAWGLWSETSFFRSIAFYIPGNLVGLFVSSGSDCSDWFRVLDCPIINLVTVLFYFLVGWGVHSLIRKLSKKKR